MQAIEIPLVKATNETLKGYGYLIDSFENSDVEIVTAPPENIEDNTEYSEPEEIYIWHVNYHPDGGQLFFPSERGPFISPLALPGDDIQAEDFKAFYFDGSKGLYIHPNIWHEGVFPVQKKSSFMGKQGKVHARVSIDLKKEFNKYLFFKTKL